VIVPTLTYIASANAVTYCGATPVFVDSDPETGNIDVTRIEQAITPRTKAVMVVHLYGHPVDMDPVCEIASSHGLAVVEDAAEAHGALYRGRPIGSLGDIAAFSFFGNKIISTGEGGMVVTDDPEIAQRVRMIRGQGQDPERRYRFPVVGFNYRMTNIAAAIGLAQMERFEWHLAQRQRNAAWYAERLGGRQSLRLLEEPSYAVSAFWLNGVVLSERCPLTRDELAKALEARGVETRPFFYPCHTMPPYRDRARDSRFPNADRLSANGLSLPSSALLSEEDVDRVCQALLELTGD
jgi:perosamine synthetase